MPWLLRIVSKIEFIERFLTNTPALLVQSYLPCAKWCSAGDPLPAFGLIGGIHQALEKIGEITDSPPLLEILGGPWTTK